MDFRRMTASPPSPSLRRRSILLAGGAAAVATLPAWPVQVQSPAPAPTQAGQPSPVSAADLRKVTLRIGDQTGLSQGHLRTAGLLDDLPYQIEWSQYAAAVNLHEALKAGAIDVGLSNDSPTVSAISGGSRIVVVAAWNNGGRGATLLVPRNSKITRVAELRGKTISPTTRGSVGHYLVVEELKQAGLQPGDVKLAFLAPPDATAAFGSGSIDAWATWGIFKSRAIGSLGARELDDGHTINTGLGILSATQAAVHDPAMLAAIRHYAALLDRGFDWGRHNRAAYLDWYAVFAKQDKSILGSSYEENVGYKRIPIDDTLVARLKKTHDVWVENGLLSGSVDFNAYVLRDTKA